MASARLVVTDIRIAADVEERARGVEDGERQVATEPVGVVDVEDGGPGWSSKRCGHLLVVEGKLIPVDVSCRTEFPGHADRVAVRLEQVTDILGSTERVVGLRRFARLAREKRVSRQAEDVDADRGETDVGVSDDRTGLFVALPKADAEFVTATSGPGSRISWLVERGALQTRLVLFLGVRSWELGECGGVLPRLAPDADVVP